MTATYVNFDAKARKKSACKNWCVLTACVAFAVGVSLGVAYATSNNATPPSNASDVATIRAVFVDNSYAADANLNDYPTVSFVDTDDALDARIDGGVYWGDAVEDAMPRGYDADAHRAWNRRVRAAVAVKLASGCGRMQNRLVVFADGTRGCARYRQNTDQIQGELFSFYLAQILRLRNLAPSAVAVVDAPIFARVRGDVAAAQWASQRAVVVTEYIDALNSANIPLIFRPTERHLNRHDVANMSVAQLVELAQWSDLIVFDYLTANLDRIVNNLYNYQWNANIMEAPAHNLARRADDALLIFLDNESGLLHGYRLLKKYEIYHAVLLDNLCVFRKSTADAIRRLRRDGNVGALLRDKFERFNGAAVKEVLPTLPDKSVKVLNERIQKVYDQIVRCESVYADKGAS